MRPRLRVLQGEDGPELLDLPDGWVGNVIVAGLFSGSWKIHPSWDNTALEVRLLRPVPKSEMQALGPEAERLLVLAHPDVADHDVVIHQVR